MAHAGGDAAVHDGGDSVLLGQAIEVDGAMHLGDAEAYRRDRHKDRLLQENGYTVLRFLAEDLAKDLDTVLDAVLRALTGYHSVRSAITSI